MILVVVKAAYLSKTASRRARLSSIGKDFRRRIL